LDDEGKGDTGVIGALRKTVSALIGLFVFTGSLVGSVDAANATSDAHQVAMLGCLSQRLVKPSTYSLGCGSGTYVITNAHWVNWGIDGARGTGNYVVNTCSPTCAADNNDSYSASFVVRNIKPTARGPVYKVITIRYLQAGKFTKISWTLPPFST
jgi:hypothetical protein